MPGWGVTYTDLVRVTVIAGGQMSLVREGSGAMEPQARAAVAAGQHGTRSGGGGAAPSSAATCGQPASVSRPASVPPTPSTAPAQCGSATTDPGQVALNPETIQQLHNTLRTLPRPLLESLTRAFRKRFQVPKEAVTIADRINQKCHHD